MNRNSPVREVMTTEVVTLGAFDSVETALHTLVERGPDGVPVLDGDGRVVGVLSSADLLIKEAEVHAPSFISLLDFTFEWGRKHFEEDLRRALGTKVEQLMTADPYVCGPDESIEKAATLMHDHHVSRLPVVDGDGRVLGIVARRDILRAILLAGGE
jgi:CBS domain-containing protein